MEPPNPSSLRVLIRPSSSAAAATSSGAATTSSSSADSAVSSATTLNPSPRPPSLLHPAPPKPPPVSPLPPPEGVVVVGFVGTRSDIDSSHLINRILDANVFGSGGLDRDLGAAAGAASGLVGLEEEWLRHRRVSYYHEEEKGVVFLQFSSSLSVLERLSSSSRGYGGCDDGGEYDLALEDWESDDLRGMLFMFLVCHVIIFLHEGIQLDTHILRKLRMLQRAKNALAPSLRTLVTPVDASKTSAALSQPAVPSTSSRSPGRVGSGRHGSSVSLMSGTGSHLSVLPGQCTPVTLFVFLDEFLDGTSTVSTAVDSSEPLPNLSSSLDGMSRPSGSFKPSGSLVVLARPATKFEGSFRKKLQSSLDSQIRFLIKKCRTLVGGETGSRGAGNVTSLTLLSLDASRAVVLLEKSTHCRGKTLDMVTSLIEDILNSRVASDIFTFENHSQSSNAEDIQSIKDFIYRQVDSLRGRGALTNTSSGSAVGVGMVAAAAAAAAASASAGKPLSAPKLPSLENWASLCNTILGIVLSVRHLPLDEIQLTRKVPARRNVHAGKDEGKSLIGHSAAESAISCLESCRALNLRFSMAWCQRALPAAKEVYLKDLPTCYPTSLHKSQLEKALNAFQLMVKGPAVQSFLRRLEEECGDIWKSGRQLCDAVSLTGKPCMHQRHDVDSSDSQKTDTKQHSSGYVFLHACACGRSRRLRADPFDFDSANISFNCFPNCENFLPALKLPKGTHRTGAFQSSWSLIRLGGARYYEPSKGLLQSGFCGMEKFLLKWEIVLEKSNEEKAEVICTDTAISSEMVPTVMPAAEKETRDASDALPPEVQTAGSEHQKKDSDAVGSQDSHIHFGRGFPSFIMKKKAFSEVVAGTASTVNQSFPPLQSKKQPIAGFEKAAVRAPHSNQTNEHVNLVNGSQNMEKTKHTSCQESSNGLENDQKTEGPFLQIGSNVLPVNGHGGGKIETRINVNQFSIYVGFEHECPHGHRFLLSEEHISSLDSLYSSIGSVPTISKEFNGNNRNSTTAEHKKANMNGKSHGHFPAKATNSISNIRQKNRLSESLAKCNMRHIGKGHPSRPADGLEENLLRIRLNDGGKAYSLLNRNLPIYMNCPYCKSHTEESHQMIKFASSVSQLQRIFLVTPPFPVVLAACPVVQFEESRLPPAVLDRVQQSQFGLDCRVVLPPESFLVLRLPFVYGVQVDDKSLQPLNYFEQQPELTAWLVKGTALNVVSKGYIVDGMH